jgi:hypothetical protein
MRGFVIDNPAWFSDLKYFYLAEAQRTQRIYFYCHLDRRERSPGCQEISPFGRNDNQAFTLKNSASSARVNMYSFD